MLLFFQFAFELRRQESVRIGWSHWSGGLEQRSLLDAKDAFHSLVTGVVTLAESVLTTVTPKGELASGGSRD